MYFNRIEVINCKDVRNKFLDYYMYYEVILVE